MPAATPAARKPAGSVPGSSSRACAGSGAQRELKPAYGASPRVAAP